MSKPKKPLRKKNSTCTKKGHTLRILREDDGEVAAICSDSCERCGHLFTAREAEGILADGVYTSSMHADMMARG